MSILFFFLAQKSLLDGNNCDWTITFISPHHSKPWNICEGKWYVNKHKMWAVCVLNICFKMDIKGMNHILLRHVRQVYLMDIKNSSLVESKFLISLSIISTFLFCRRKRGKWWHSCNFTFGRKLLLQLDAKQTMH